MTNFPTGHTRRLLGLPVYTRLEHIRSCGIGTSRDVSQ